MVPLGVREANEISTILILVKQTMYKTQSQVETPMEKKYREMVNTRRLYKFEGDFFHRSHLRYMTTQLTKQTLVNIGKIIWNDQDNRFLIPEIRFGKGLYHGTAKGQKYYYSWCDRQTIELAPTQRDILTLIHEMVHALGCDYHDSKFVGKYIELLTKYAGVPKKELIKGMMEYKVAVPRKYKRLYTQCKTTTRTSRRTKK